MPKPSDAKVIPLVRKVTDVDPLSDAALVAACATGDPNALAQLFDRMCDDVARFLGRLAYVDEQDVQDLVHDVFLTAFHAAGTYRRSSSVKTWLLAIAGNLARQKCRKAVRGRAAADKLARELHMPQGSLEGLAVSNNLLEHVVQCIPLLPYDLRVAFLMCDVEELPSAEVASALDIPKGTLYRRLHEARRMLRVLIEAEGV